ncbi:hypothetical protein [Streptomyces sp. NPDC093795]
MWRFRVASPDRGIGNIFSEFDLPVAAEGHRRVLAVLAFLRS